MKNTFYKSRILFFLFLLPGFLMTLPLAAQNFGLQNCIITATGTGKTTGDVVAMTIYNPSEKEARGSIGPLIIPCQGDYQSYITLKYIPEIVVPSKGSIDMKLSGYCIDVTKRAATEKDIFKPINEWIKIDENATGQIPPFKTTINPDTNPGEAGPYLLKAIEEISKSYDKLKSEGKISTPFSGNPEKEREAVIQQTFWIYTSELRQKPYTKEQFSTRTYEQYEEKTNIKPITLPTGQKQQLDKGIDDFWNTFQAIGTEAKILNIPSKPKEPEIVTPISTPEVKHCFCGECRLVEGQRIEIYLEKDGSPFAGDSIPWSTNQIFIDRPEILTTCVPDDCPPYREFEMRTTITYKDKRYNAPPPAWGVYDFTRKSPVMEHQGEMLIEFHYKCFCGSTFCGEGTSSRKVYFIERNNCCDSIRAKNNGDLQFNFKGGNAKISGQKFSVHSDVCGDQDFNFGFNLEAIFCNLSNDQVFSELIAMAQSNLSKGNLKEFHSTRNMSMGGPATDPNMARFYGFSFSKLVNGKEISVFISIDKERCVFDLSLLCDDKLYEFSAPPYLSPAQIAGMANGLNVPTSQQSWVNAMLILSHLARADEHNQGAAYQQALRTYLAKILNQVSILTNNPKNAPLMGQLEALRMAAGECLAKGDFKLLDNVMTKMIPILNAMN